MLTQHLRFLVVDETDRLLRQSYQEWLPHVLACLAGSSGAAAGTAAAGTATSSTAAGTTADTAAAGASPGSRRVVKLVVSATLTRDPAKLERLQLVCPRYIAMSAVDHR
jgi:ATP-dependent RNA helicase DDX51/DBP6